MHYYKRNLGDYAKKAGRLSMLQHGSYTLLIDACYDREQFPTEQEAIDWTWASSTEEVEAVKFVLSKFFTLENGRYVQARIQEELNDYRTKSETNARIAAERESKRKESSTNRSRNVGEPSPNQEPRTTNQEPQVNQKHLPPASPAAALETPQKKSTKFDPLTAKPLNVSDGAWADWCAHRKKSGMTAKACELIAKKLDGHHDPDSVLYHSIQNGWTGLFPEKITHENGSTNRGTVRLSAVDQVKQAIAEREASANREAVAAADRQALAENDRDVRPPLDGEFRRVG